MCIVQEGVHMHAALLFQSSRNESDYHWVHQALIMLTCFTIGIIWEADWFFITDRKVSGKTKDEQMAEKKQELEKRLQDVSGQLGAQKSKQQAKKGKI